MKISIFGWGSIVWNPRELSIIAGFEPIGPRLPIEFCHISRDGRLTLVIDDSLGVPCITYSARSTFDDLDGAIENLRLRENMPTKKGVGFAVVDCSKQSTVAIERHLYATKIITAWAQANALDAVVWTALASNFMEKTNEPFSVEVAVRYLETKTGKVLEDALTYIRNAPSEVQTPLREAVNARWPVSVGHC
jgi:hypothetical protein